MMDLWTLFVENTFGGFWMSIVGLTTIMFFIMMVGRVSIWSILIYLSFFVLAIAIGYGHPLVTIPIAIFIMIYFTFSFLGYIGTGGERI